VDRLYLGIANMGKGLLCSGAWLICSPGRALNKSIKHIPSTHIQISIGKYAKMG